MPQDQVGVATGINTVMRTVGGAFGAAIATAILTAHLIDGTLLPTEGAYTTAFVVSRPSPRCSRSARRCSCRSPARAARTPARQPTPTPETHLMELGIYTFGERTPIRDRRHAAQERMRDLLEEIELADQVGLDVFGVGEHHRPDFVVSAPAVVLAAGRRAHEAHPPDAAPSRVLSSDDPVRVFQDFATLDLLSGGRAEIMAGRGSFIESFPLFGYDLDDYDELFAEKLELLLKLRESERGHLVGRATARRSTTWASTRARCRTRCRSGSPSAARRSRSCAPARSACRWRSRSSAASRSASRRWSSCYREAARRGRPRPGAAAGRASTRTASSPTTSQQARDDYLPGVRGA